MHAIFVLFYCHSGLFYSFLTVNISRVVINVHIIFNNEYNNMCAY